MSSNARSNGPRLSGKMSSWLLHHVQSIVFSLGKLYKSPLATLMTIAVIAITLSLPSSFYLFLKNLKSLSGDIRSSTQITLYLDTDVSEKEALSLQKELLSDLTIESIDFLSKTKALESFKQSSGLSKSIEQLDVNPLPHTLIVQPVNNIDTFKIKTLLAKLDAYRLVSSAKMDTEWINRLFSILTIIERAIMIISLLFSFAVLLIVGNTIRLDIQNRRKEITVIKMIGATDAFIRRPFLYGGVWYGFLGGMLSWCIVMLSVFLLSKPVENLSLLYQTQIEMSTFTFFEFLILLFSSTLLGLIGSWIAVSKHLTSIEPT